MHSVVVQKTVEIPQCSSSTRLLTRSYTTVAHGPDSAEQLRSSTRSSTSQFQNSGSASDSIIDRV